jgi:hypothetical protein
MMKITHTKSGGCVIEADTRIAKVRVEWDARGRLVSESAEVYRAPESIPADFDPETLKQRGCCDPPANPPAE